MEMEGWEAAITLFGTLFLTVASVSFFYNAGVSPGAFDHLIIFIIAGSLVVSGTVALILGWIVSLFRR